VSTVEHVDALTLAQIGRMLREAVRDRTYESLSLGPDVAAYLRAKGKRLTPQSFEVYEATLAKFVVYFVGLELSDFEPPAGTTRIEEFLDEFWSEAKARTYNKNLSIVRDFCKHHRIRQRMDRDPTEAIEPRKEQTPYRTTFSPDQRRAILAAQTDLRDLIALRLLLEYGLRRGSLLAIQFKHFDHVRKRLTIFAKGGKVRSLPIPDPAFWHDLGRLLVDCEAHGDHYLMPRMVSRREGNRPVRRVDPTKPMASHGAHNWWYRCLERAGVVDPGVTKGEHMHKARHTAGQRLLDHTGNLKAVQQLLGHASITTTADVYLDWDEQALSASLESVMEAETKRSEDDR
jgi:integrase/recombinase XerC